MAVLAFLDKHAPCWRLWRHEAFDEDDVEIYREDGVECHIWLDAARGIEVHMDFTDGTCLWSRHVAAEVLAEFMSGETTTNPMQHRRDGGA